MASPNTQHHKRKADHEAEHDGATDKKVKTGGRVLILGSGLVSPPIIRYLAENGFHVTVAARTMSKTLPLLQGLANASAVEFDIEHKDSMEKLDELTSKHDLVVSLLPYIHHVAAAKVAIKHAKHFFTTSYVSDGMRALEAEAKAAGVILLNECGVDPGLDHMSAQKIIDHVHAHGGSIRLFYSICGGLPSPAANNNPLCYKLSWSPRGVLLASKNNALFLQDGKDVSIPGSELFKRHRVEDLGGDIGKLEWYYNRNSVMYRDIYRIPEVQTLIRGTYRYPGWCEMMDRIAASGLTSIEVDQSLVGKSYAQFAAQVLGLGNAADVKSAAAAKLGVPADGAVIKKLEWLGLFSNSVLPPRATTPLDALCHLWEEKLQYAPGEKDLLVMKHTFEVEWKDGSQQTITSTMIDYGLQPDGNSSMSRTVSLPVAAAVRFVLDGSIKLAPGLYRPVIPELYNPILAEMEKQGIFFKEETHKSPLLWIRSEVKPGEQRVGLTPVNAAKLITAGFRICVEQSPHRCIPDSEYEVVGCKLVAEGSWPTAPKDAIIFGVKELPENDDPLHHRHLYFAHCYKNQGGWKQVLNKFVKGNGMLWDLEFLVDDIGRRVAAFGRPAGLVGMALGIYTWACQQLHVPVGALSSWKNVDALVADVKAKVAEARAATGKPAPTALVLGALGRSGKGAVWFAQQAGIETVNWDLDETKAGGPFEETLKHEILVNCIYLSGKIPPFLTQEMVARADRKLTVIADVSCDTSNPNNPLPIYSQVTTLKDPVVRVVADQKNPLDVIAIDHLPSLVPLESSIHFSDDLLPTLLTLRDAQLSPVFQRAEKLFHDKVASMASSA